MGQKKGDRKRDKGVRAHARGIEGERRSEIEMFMYIWMRVNERDRRSEREREMCV